MPAETLPVDPASGVEAELKLLADDPRALRGLARRARLGPASLGPAVTASETDRYLDTADLRLAAAGWACRLRTRGSRTIVSLKGGRLAGSGSVHRRPELEGEAAPSTDPATWPDSAARRLVMRVSRGAHLVERITLRQRRTERTVRVADDPAGTLSIDRVDVVHRRRHLGRLLIVELELTNDPPSSPLTAQLTLALADVPGLHPDPLSKLEHALRLLAATDDQA